MDKNFGKIGRKIAEISFFGEPRKEKRMENSSARKIGKKSGLSAIFRRKIGNFRFFGGKIGCVQHALEGGLTEGKIAFFRREVEFIADKSSIYQPFFRKNPGKSWPIRFLIPFDPTVQICSACFLKSNGYIFYPKVDFKSKA